MTPLTITFAEIATHNHFVLDRGGKVFKQTAPVIKLPEGATEEEHLALLGLLNSSTADFWARQVCYPKGGDYVGTEGARVTLEPWSDRLQRAGSALEKFPVAPHDPRTLKLTRQLDKLAAGAQDLEPAVVTDKTPTRAALDEARARQDALFQQRIALQEELDWLCYELYGILEKTPLHSLEALPPLQLGERAFEIALARAVEAGDEETTWFTRHRSQPRTTLPDHWPDSYKTVVEERLRLIEEHRFIQLLEKPEHKRRWQREPWEVREKAALEDWLLDRLEAPSLWGGEPEPVSVHKLAERLRKDPDFLSVLELYKPDADLEVELTKLISNEGVPFLAAWRYTGPGLEKRAEWESVWDLQRQEDAGETVGSIPVPPKYASTDFQQASSWRLRGKLDVPKERFILYPECERETDKSLVLGWAGWDHLQRAMALATYYRDRTEIDGWPSERLVPLLAGLQELVPWVKQWHNEFSVEYEHKMGDYYATFTDTEARRLGLTLEDLRQWRPAEGARKKGRKKNTQ